MIGLTGGIGSGKSTVARLLAERGALVIDADALAREVVEPGTPGLATVRCRFGAGVVRADGSLDRAALGAIVFADPTARRDLEAITHPLIRDRTRAIIAAAPPGTVVVHDIPLLVETGVAAQYHLVVTVDVGVEERIRRLVALRGLAEDDARARITHQVSDTERRAVADVVIDNNGAPDALVAQVEALWRRAVAFEDHLRRGEPVRRPEQPVLVAADPTWPDQAHRLLGRLRYRLSPLLGEGLALHHIGSTAVPGLAARDVIDLQIGLSAPADADRAEVRDALGRLGFPRAEEARGNPAVSGGVWPERLHLSCDPERTVHLHLRPAGSPGWRWALLFRDWLRADPDARQEYVQLKRDLAAREATIAAYARAKEPWFRAHASRAESWAATTSWRIPAE